jgi:hypothetical protein
MFLATPTTMVFAQGGGYPASPSHGVMGTPNPDGSPRYGREPGKDAKPPGATVGRSASGDRHGAGPREGDKLPASPER